MIKPTAWKGSDKGLYPHPCSQAHGLCWSALRSRKVIEREDAGDDNPPICCSQSQRRQNRRQLLEIFPPPSLFPSLKRPNKHLFHRHHAEHSRDPDFSPWMAKLQILSLAWHKQHFSVGADELANISALLQEQSCSQGQALSGPLFLVKSRIFAQMQLSCYILAFLPKSARLGRSAPCSHNRNALHRL